MTTLSDPYCEEKFERLRKVRIYKVPSLISLRLVVSILEFIREMSQSIEIIINACRGKKTVIVFIDDDWELLSETLELDAHSSGFDMRLRKDIQAALDRTVVLDVDLLKILRLKSRNIEARLKRIVQKGKA